MTTQTGKKKATRRHIRQSFACRRHSGSAGTQRLQTKTQGRIYAEKAKSVDGHGQKRVKQNPCVAALRRVATLPSFRWQPSRGLGGNIHWYAHVSTVGGQDRKWSYRVCRRTCLNEMRHHSHVSSNALYNYLESHQ